MLCVFQRVRYRVVISHGGDTVLELTREFNYSEDDPSDCIEDIVSGELEEGTEYEVQVFLYAGESGNFSTNKTTFSEPSLVLCLTAFSSVGKWLISHCVQDTTWSILVERIITLLIECMHGQLFLYKYCLYS